MIMPTHIVTGAGVVENDKNVKYLAYVTKPEFDLQVSRKI